MISPATQRQHKHIALSQATTALLVRDGHLDQSSLESRDIEFGPLKLPPNKMAPHFVTIGSSGAGKTIIQKGLMQSALGASMDEGGLRHRAVIFDPKRELYPFLVASEIPHEQIIVTHPFDDRSAAWDLATDFQEPAQIEELAELIVPRKEKGNENDFFHDAARIIVGDVIHGLRTVKELDWTLRDLTEACSTFDVLIRVLNLTDTGAESAQVYLNEDLGSNRMVESIWAMVYNHVRPFYTLAALWHRAPYSFSLTEWHQGSGVILFGADPRRERTLHRINHLMIRRMSQLVLGREEENPSDLTWCFFDEIRGAGKLDGIRQLATEGRSKGARMSLGFQDLDGMISVYGQHETGELIGLCANRIVLHLDNPDTQKWASQVFGEAEIVQIEENSSTTRTESFGAGAKTFSSAQTQGENNKIGTWVNALPIEFQDMPLGSLDDGVRGWFAVPGRRNKFHLNADDVAEFLKLEDPALSKTSKERAFIPRPTEHQQRIPWSEQELTTIAARRAFDFSGPEATSRQTRPIRLGSVEEKLKR